MAIKISNLYDSFTTLCELHFNEDGEIYKIVVKPKNKNRRKTIKPPQFINQEMFEEIKKVLKKYNKGEKK